MKYQFESLTPRRAAKLLALIAVLATTAFFLISDAEDPAEPVPALCQDREPGDKSGLASDSSWQTDPAAFIAHGGGGIQGNTYTNSLEAVELSIQRGYRMIELDLLVTKDGFLIAAHDWKSFRQRTGYQELAVGDEPMTLAEAKALRIDGRYTPLDEKSIRKLFLKHPELTLVTDKISDFPRLAKALPFQDRVIVEVFSTQDVALARASGILNPMYSVGNLQASIDRILQMPVRHVALSLNSLRRCPGAAKKIVDSGRKVFLYTTDDASFMKRFVGSHVSAFYTDRWHVGLGRCEGASCPLGDPPNANVR